MVAAMRLANPLRRVERTANEANANDPAKPPANMGSETPPARRRRPGWWSRRKAIQLAARRAYARMRTAPSSLSRTAELVAYAISVLAYAISYASLYDLASRHNFGGPENWESIAWPTTVDLASLATGIIALDQAHRGKSAWLAGVISAVAAAIMVLGNVLANAGDAISVGMHAWPPVIALACWYLLVRTRRSNAVDRGLLEDDDSSPDEPAASQDDDDGDAEDDSRPPRGPDRRVDPRVLRIARARGNWRRVAAATGLQEHAAKRALTAARKQLANETRARAQRASTQAAA